MAIRVFLCDPWTEARKQLRSALERAPDIAVVGEAADGYEAVTKAQQLRPDVTVTELHLASMDGIQVTQRLADDRLTRPVPVLILTAVDLDEEVITALRAGASGFLLKRDPPELIALAIRALAAGQAMITPSVTRRLLNRYSSRLPGPSMRPPAPLSCLTDRELQVFRLLAKAYTNGEIAAVLSLSEATIRSHVHHLLGKLGLPDRTRAVVLAYETGLVWPCCGEPAVRRLSEPVSTGR